MSQAIQPSDYIPIDPRVRADPYPYYEVLRREAPVHQIVPGLPFWALSRYDDVAFALHNPQIFSSTAFREIIEQSPAPGELAPNGSALQGHRVFATPMLISVDPPDHAPMRRIVNRGFTPRRIREMEPRIREITTAYLDKALGGERMELVADLAIPLPVTVIAELLGIEPGRRDEFKHWSDAIVFGMSGISGEYSAADVRGAADEMADFFDRIADERRRHPQDDLISAIVAAEGGDGLSSDEVMSFAVLLLIAGNETTTNLIGNAMKALLHHPEQLSRVQADPALIPGMLEETLRYESPIQSLPRLVMTDVEIEGTPIPKDARVLVLMGSANRDASRFPDPDRFDIERGPKDHLAFGHGIHFCLGAALARLEGRVAFEELFSRARDFELLTREILPHDSLLVRGPKELEIGFRPC
jgi:cytochrome P450